MHILGWMTISMKHVASNWVTFNDFASPDNMPHGNSYGSLSPFMPTILPKSEKADFFTIYYWTLKDVRNNF